jgi:hypothetical protein
VLAYGGQAEAEAETREERPGLGTTNRALREGASQEDPFPKLHPAFCHVNRLNKSFLSTYDMQATVVGPGIHPLT